MDQSVSIQIAPRLSLTAEDVLAIENALPRLLGSWRLLTEYGEEGEFYGRLLPPWSEDERSAFLIEREDARIILTDNLSQWDRCDITSHHNAGQAMAAVQRVVHGAS